MKTVQMTLDDDLVKAVDRAVKRLHTTRSAFARDALREALRQVARRDKERRDRDGYAAKPAVRGELIEWDGERTWPE